MVQATWRREAKLDFARISVRVQDLPDRFSVEAAVQDPFVKPSVQGVCKRFTRKLTV